MNTQMAAFFRRAALVATRAGHPELALAASMAALETHPAFTIGNVSRPAPGLRARPGFVGHPSAPPSNAPTPSGPPYPCPGNVDPNTWDYNRGCPIDVCSDMTTGVTMGCETPRVCNYNVIGANTLGTAGIAPGTASPVNFTAGDATSFTPKFLYFEAQPYNDENTINITLLPASRDSAPVLLQDALIGRVSQIRRGGNAAVAIPSSAYAATKDLTRVDWGTFTSTQEKNLSLVFYNPNSVFPIHSFACLWGDI